MITKIDIENAWKLYSIITESKFYYSDDITTYNKLVATMDRMIDSIKTLNSIEVKPNINESTKDFMLWIFYADMLKACIFEISQVFNITIQQLNNIFAHIHNLNDKNDNDYFRFVRAIILPHALSLDDKKQKAFTQNKKAYCPSVFWSDNNQITISYFLDDLNNHRNYISIPANLFFDYINDLSKNILLFQPIIEQRKISKRANTLSLLANEHFNTSMPISDKIIRLSEILNKYGDIDDQKGISYQTLILEKVSNIINFDFDINNKQIIDKYIVLLDDSLNDMFSCIQKQNNNNRKIDDLVFPLFNYTSSYSKNFLNCGYEINKIIHEQNTFDDFIEKCYFPDWLKKIKPALTEYLVIKDDMTMQEICYLTTIAFYFEKEKNNNE